MPNIGACFVNIREVPLGPQRRSGSVERVHPATADVGQCDASLGPSRLR